mmetsp:Transcript_38191/g.59073  ORF Transcript_38191/g.59073 Transcript_38191/m.59073 type:complete len:94 (+) Transcript_38191:65-346(+)
MVSCSFLLTHFWGRSNFSFVDGQRCHNCMTWGPTGDGDNSWYEKTECTGCTRRLVEGHFKAADTLTAQAEEMKAKLASTPSPAEKAEQASQIE